MATKLSSAQLNDGLIRMSLVKCAHCYQVFSSDNDPDCFCEAGYTTATAQEIILCEQCREDGEMEEDRKISP